MELPTSTPIAAGDTLPQSFGSLIPSWLFPLKSKLPKDGRARFYLCCSRWYPGWIYWRKDKTVRITENYPEDYEKDIQEKYKSPGELAKPSDLWIARAWHVESGSMVLLTIDSVPVLKELNKKLRHDEFYILENNVSNFFLTFAHDSAPTQKALTYTVDVALRPTTNADILAGASTPWWPEVYWESGGATNPLVPPASKETTVGAQPPQAQQEEALAW